MTVSPRQLQRCAWLGLSAFAGIVLVLHILSPEVLPLSQGISYYALGRFGWMFTVSMLFLSFACVAILVLLGREVRSWAGYLGIALLLAWTFLMEAGGFFPMDAPGAPPTSSGTIHSLAGLSFLLVPPAALMIEWSLSRARLHRVHRSQAWMLAWAVGLASALLLTFNGFLVHWGVGGLAQRAYWLTIVVWLFFLAEPVRSTVPDADPATTSR